ncbi:hypothetical protein SNE35_26270 [Paucibacter sp. R3-3]|uniref:PEP-CTERM protein-sorting domain-containing protein n=1 Tax=Roseateles agri TaxID=3098619 RepID=A0ABU5DP15_9BURK|nr:hypothetical protein [Paucibacter sp. R3-3]MDY0748033.1 hypothetical protein [Paucibacter sp. R3-3]
MNTFGTVARFVRRGMLAVVLLGAGACQASLVTLTFEGLSDLAKVGDFYDGGLDGAGQGPGPDDGIKFSSDAIALIASSAGGSGVFSGAPSGVGALFFLSGAGTTINVAAGFSNEFSLFYSAFAGGSFSIYDGLDGTGTLLGSETLAVTPNTSNQLNAWVEGIADFSGTAHSVVLSGVANRILFDNLSFDIGAADNSIPEPGSLPLVVTAAAVLGLAGQRRARALRS